MNPILYYVPPSPPCRTVLLLGKMLGLDFNLKMVNILEMEHLKPEFVAVRFISNICWKRFSKIFLRFQKNPQHTIPTLEDQSSGLILWESRVILTYLTSAYGRSDMDNLYPGNIRDRAMVDQRLSFDLSTLYQRTVDYFVRLCLNLCNQNINLFNYSTRLFYTEHILINLKKLGLQKLQAGLRKY